MRIVISNASKLPIYEQIIKEVRESIINGTLKPNEQLPSIRSLAKDLNISVITTKRAYDELENQGLIETVAGKGSFVCYFNRELIYEEKLKEIEKKLEEVVEMAEMISLDREKINEILDLLYEGV